MSNTETKYKQFPLWEQTETLTLEPQQTHTITLPPSIESAAKSFYFTQNVLKNGASEYQYNVKSSINVKISYKNQKLKNENFMVLFNRDVEEVDGVFTNDSILELQGNDIESIELKIKNNSDTENLTISKMSIFESDDVKITTIAKVIQEEVISAQIIHLTGGVFTNNLFAQWVQTNILSMIDRNSQAGQEVGYMVLQGMEHGCYTTTLTEETSQLVMQYEISGTQYNVPIFYSTITGDDAYKFYTTNNPKDLYPDMPDSEVDKFRVMIRLGERIKKMSSEFALDELNALTPFLFFGRGSSEDETSWNGKGVIYKNTNGFYMIYTTSQGRRVGIIMDENGVHIVGWVDQHCESIRFKRNGVKIKFVGEDTHSFEYIFNDSEILTGILQNQTYMTDIGYDDEDL